MRFYAKLSLFAAAFLALASSFTPGSAASDVAYMVRVKYVLAFGSEADYQALIDDTQRALAAASGRVDVYEAGKRYHALRDRQLAEAARRGITLTHADMYIIHVQCMREAYADVPQRHRPISPAPDELPPPTPR